MSRAIQRAIITAVARAEDGVTYSPRHGARCPMCGRRLRVTVTKPWDGAARVRWHRCQNPGCVLAGMGKAVKSVEMEG